MTQQEPWWTKNDRESLEQMRNAIKGKPETGLVRYCGDMRPMMVSDVRIRMRQLLERIASDVTRFNAASCDYARMNEMDDAEVMRRAGF